MAPALGEAPKLCVCVYSSSSASTISELAALFNTASNLSAAVSSSSDASPQCLSSPSLLSLIHFSDCLLSGTRFTCFCPSLQSRSIGNEHGMNQHLPTAGGPKILVAVGAPTSLLLSNVCGGLLVSHSPSFSSANPCVECGHSELVLQKYRKVMEWWEHLKEEIRRLQAELGWQVCKITARHLQFCVLSRFHPTLSPSESNFKPMLPVAFCAEAYAR